MNSLKEYFGNDNFNILYKLLKHIDKNTNFYTELVEIYSKYNIILSKSVIEVKNPKKINEIKNIISELSTYDMEIPNLIEKIESGKAYKMSLKSKNKQLILYPKVLMLMKLNLSINTSLQQNDILNLQE